jgi:type II secretory pathway pseudopilin PulG
MELMVVLIILAVLASIALPRVTGSAKRSFETSVDQLSDLLMMYAQRDRLSERPVGIQYDPTRRWLMLVVMQTEDDNKGRWVIDRFVNPVKLPELIDADTLIFSADDEPLDIVNFPLTHQPGESRPTITVTVQSEERAFEAMLHLAPHDLAPRRIDGNDYYVARQGIDLDSVGRAREDW